MDIKNQKYLASCDLVAGNRAYCIMATWQSQVLLLFNFPPAGNYATHINYSFFSSISHLSISNWSYQLIGHINFKIVLQSAPLSKTGLLLKIEPELIAGEPSENQLWPIWNWYAQFWNWYAQLFDMTDLKLQLELKQVYR